MRATPRRILVTGATAPVGRAVCGALLARPEVELVFAVGREPPERAGLGSHGGRLCYRQADLAGWRRMHDLLFGPARRAGIEVLAHLAWHRSSHTGRRVHALHVEALRSALEALDRHPSLRRVVLRSHADVYRVAPHLATIVDESHPLRIGDPAPQWLLDRVEADLEAAVRVGASGGEICVLRCAEVLAAGTGSQLYDYLSAPVCFTPLGFDPMLNLLSLEDVADAIARACTAASARGIYNVPGADTLPVSECIRLAGRIELPLPGPCLDGLYELRRAVRGADFSYRHNERRLHFPAVLDGGRIAREFGYRPRVPLRWPPR
ncbi:MAG: hypothetical protein D6776_01620 [Planctomycetota bacterium]|nr:MAG: hypothetical protein D6776_01620 [Planctomycetota bacterium]